MKEVFEPEQTSVNWSIYHCGVFAQQAFLGIKWIRGRINQRCSVFFKPTFQRQSFWEKSGTFLKSFSYQIQPQNWLLRFLSFDRGTFGQTGVITSDSNTGTCSGVRRIFPKGGKVSSQSCDVTNQFRGSAEGTTILGGPGACSRETVAKLHLKIRIFVHSGSKF